MADQVTLVQVRGLSLLEQYEKMDDQTVGGSVLVDLATLLEFCHDRGIFPDAVEYMHEVKAEWDR